MNLDTNTHPNPRALPYGSSHWQRDKHPNPHRRSFVTGLNGSSIGLGDDYQSCVDYGMCNFGSGTPTYTPSSSPGSFDPTAQIFGDIANITKGVIPLVVSQTPGAIYQQAPNGQIMVYAQPTGSTQNLPVGMLQSGAYPGSAYGTLSSPLGSASLSGNMMPLLLLGIAAIFLLKK